MLVRVSRFALFVGLATVPLASFSCEGEDRKFVESGGGSSGRGGGAGDASIAGNAGQGGDAGPDSGDGGKRCTQPSDCNDEDSCNGVETCTGGYCQSGTRLADGTTCTPVVGSVIRGDAGTDAGDAGGVSDGGDAGSASYICASGSCVVRCESKKDCDDNNVCTDEICNPTTHTCASGTPLPCEDNNACTQNSCDPEKGCIYPLIDADEDGHAAESLGTCGDDCNDNDKTIFTGAAELCTDNKDNNCNDQTDESAPFWYPDCDNDTFPPAGALGEQGCTKPPARPTACDAALTAATWTLTAPTPDTTDCWDRDARVHPYTTAENNSAWQTGLISGRASGVDADWNCDTDEEKRYALAGVPGNADCKSSPIIFEPLSATTTLSSDTKMVPNQIIISPLIRCSGDDGYTAATAAACNSSAWFSDCEYSAADRACVRSLVWRPQQCR